MVVRHRQRLAELKPRVLVGQFAGAAGTLASLGDKGLAVHDALMDELKLGRSAAPWHVARDGMAEAVAFLGLVTGTLAKIATDVMLMMQTEVAEAFEPFVQGRGSSSTMPQKRNPISCELIIAAAKIVRRNVGLMLDAMVADHERATGPWHLEWVAIPEAFIATGGALRQARFMMEGLAIDARRMRRNLDLTGGLIVAEAVMMALARRHTSLRFQAPCGPDRPRAVPRLGGGHDRSRAVGPQLVSMTGPRRTPVSGKCGRPADR
jgi:3-carboxy-cis,cis-muconate cycloisomerase